MCIHEHIILNFYFQHSALCCFILFDAMQIQCFFFFKSITLIFYFCVFKRDTVSLNKLGHKVCQLFSLTQNFSLESEFFFSTPFLFQHELWKNTRKWARWGFARGCRRPSFVFVEERTTPADKSE